MAADPAAVVARVRAVGASLRDDGPPSGSDWCRAWTEEVDAALRALVTPVLPRPGRTALVAVGGYGRRELCPASDVDVLLLHEGRSDSQLEDLVRAVIYPLWDAGLTVGYAVRDRREAIGAIDDLDSATALLDARLVGGDRELLQEVRTTALRRLGRRPHRLLEALADADRDRRRRAGDSAEVLEPHLKDGAGGLRDVQSLRWAAAGLVGTPGLDPLVPAGYLGAADRPRLARAYELLLAARVALHLTEPPGDVLRMDLQDGVAARLGYRDAGEADLAPHQLLTELSLAARTVDHIHRRAWALIRADVARGARRRTRPAQRQLDGFEEVDGVLRLPEDADVTAPELPVRLFAALASSGAVLERRSATRIRSRVDATAADPGGGPWRWTDSGRARFCRVLWQGRIALPALAELDDVGLLTALIPEWAVLRGRPQRNPFHRYTLDRHAWHAAAALGDLVRREAWAAETLERVEDREALLLGALLHDVGKAVGEPHAETGIPVAKAIATRLGCRPATVDLIGRLVRLHLLLPDTARRRDVTDAALVATVAEQVGDHGTLAMLHLLAAADGAATGPTAWTSWTEQLVATLVAKVAAVLDATSPDAAAGPGTAHAAQELAPELGADPAAVRAHLALLPARYPAAVSARAVVRHTLMAADAPGPAEVRTRVTPGALREGEGQLDELDVVAPDHPGWFATVAGVVALQGGSIVAAEAFTREDGVAIDTFRVQPPKGAGGSWWAAVEGDLSEAAAGRLAVRARVARKARGEERRVARLPDVATELRVVPDPAGTSTIVEVHTLDRIGVLYAIATALAELQLDIVVARVQTMGHEVVDVFYLRDADGSPLDPDHLVELELAVSSALDAL